MPVAVLGIFVSLDPEEPFASPADVSEKPS